MNNCGQVVGGMALRPIYSMLNPKLPRYPQLAGEDLPHQLEHAFLWDAVDGLRDLAHLVDASGDKWLLKRADSIDDHGRIAGIGIYAPDGKVHAFLAVPAETGGRGSSTGPGSLDGPLGLVGSAGSRQSYSPRAVAAQ